MADILQQENRRREPRMTVCAKVVYANGHVKVRNSVGEAIHSPYFRTYYAMAKPGTDVVAGARGIEFTGLLSVWMPWRSGQSPGIVDGPRPWVSWQTGSHLEIGASDQ